MSNADLAPGDRVLSQEQMVHLVNELWGAIQSMGQTCEAFAGKMIETGSLTDAQKVLVYEFARDIVLAQARVDRAARPAGARMGGSVAAANTA